MTIHKLTAAQILDFPMVPSRWLEKRRRCGYYSEHYYCIMRGKSHAHSRKLYKVLASVQTKTPA